MTPLKRAFDLACTLPGVTLLSPLLLVVAALIKCNDGGPVFYRQQRIGRDGVPFRMWKFRTMVVDAEKRGLPLTVGHDPRITRVGAWLRALKLDELPQLFNVLAGEMSLVGPRPEVNKYVAYYTEAQRRVLALTPGITDPASIRYRDENDLLAQAADPERLYIERIMPEKIRLNLEYAACANCGRDFGVILRTLGILTRHTPLARAHLDARFGNRVITPDAPTTLGAGTLPRSASGRGEGNGNSQDGQDR